MNEKFDFSSLINELLLAPLEKDEEGRKIAAIFRVFAKHGIKVQEAIEIGFEIAAIFENGDGKK